MSNRTATPRKLDLLVRRSWIRLGLLVVALPVLLNAIVPQAFAALFPASAGAYAGAPPTEVVAAIVAVAILLALGGVSWVAKGDPGFHPIAATLLGMGLALAAVRVLGSDVAQAWTQTYGYSQSLRLPAPYSQGAWQVFDQGGGLRILANDGAAWTAGIWFGEVIIGGAVLAVVAALAIHVRNTHERDMSRRSRYHLAPSAPPARNSSGAATLGYVIVLFAATCALTLVGLVAGTDAQVLTIASVAMVAAAVVCQASMSSADARASSTFLVVATGTSALLGIVTLWLPLMYLYNAAWPLRITAVATGSGK